MKLKRCIAMVACCAALSMPLAAWPQAEKPKPKMATPNVPVAPAVSLNALLGLLEKEVVSAADAMPAEKYDFAPSGPGEFTGVRSFSSQVKHLAEANYEFFDGWGVPGAVDSKTIEALKSKDDIMKALRDSYKYAHTAVDSITTENAFLSLPAPESYKATRASMAAFCMAHSMDHYGQLVEYLRMNGIVPPASRKGSNM
ncbi:MAG TPA: DinB family protein [Silvibacterium sp.]|jgi:uncharacterized damage-inducible protein DinB|nr:DinB family protein [Silvibacterium sp.]